MVPNILEKKLEGQAANPPPLISIFFCIKIKIFSFIFFERIYFSTCFKRLILHKLISSNTTNKKGMITHQEYMAISPWTLSPWILGLWTLGSWTLGS